MNCKECNAYIDRFLGQLEQTGPAGTSFADIDRQVLDHMSRCHACAVRMQAARMVVHTSGHDAATVPDLPDGLQARVTESVLAAIRQEDAHTVFKDRSNRRSRLQKYLAAAAVAVLVLIPLVGDRDRGFIPAQESASQVAQVVLQLEAPQAEVVVVVGDWNNWDPQVQHLAKSNGEGTWSIMMELERGREYRYQFVIDGERWIPDPNAYLQVDDGFGGKNSVLEM
ncbi:MAG: isoamylase early set domain-containing protein [Sphaerochaeta sp.]|nr:isoamylase early set domain-containing protein [Sphaerochaeta sp.]